MYFYKTRYRFVPTSKSFRLKRCLFSDISTECNSDENTFKWRPRLRLWSCQAAKNNKMFYKLIYYKITLILLGSLQLMFWIFKQQRNKNNFCCAKAINLQHAEKCISCSKCLGKNILKLCSKYFTSGTLMHEIMRV